MSKTFEELELKFSNLETKIENKKTFVEKIYSDQYVLLNQRFDVDRLLTKHSGEFNNLRQRLLDLIATQLRSEINQVNEFVSDQKNNNFQIAKCELERPRSLDFNKSIIRSVEMCIKRLIIKEFRFGCKFSESQLIKYKNILGIRATINDLFSHLCTYLNT
jgi:hypothetical protein